MHEQCERMDEQLAQSLRMDSGLSWTIVRRPTLSQRPRPKTKKETRKKEDFDSETYFFKLTLFILNQFPPRENSAGQRERN